MKNNSNFKDPNHWLNRGIENIYPNKEELIKFLEAGNKLNIYFGIDPTGPDLHIGHGTVLIKLKELQAEGHQIIVLIGDFTAMIGDPTGKKSARQKLEPKEVKANYKDFKVQIGKILDLNKINFVFNRQWLAKLKLEDILNISSQFTVSQMLERDMFQDRIKNNEPIYLHEFMYPLMQGYDSVSLPINAEIGGTDQTFNMLMGRTMLKKLNREKFVITTKLLVDPTGKKMGKSEGNMITLSDEPSLMYGKVMSWSDDMMLLGFEICTKVDLNEIKQKIKDNPRDTKMYLAKSVVTNFIGEKEAKEAEVDFIKKFHTKEIPDDLLIIKIKSVKRLDEILLKQNLVKSKSDFKRLILGQSLTLLPSQNKITDPNLLIKETITIKIGKKRFVKIKI